MTNPDLVSLRVLVEAAIRLDHAIVAFKRQNEMHADEIALHEALPAAREALKRVENSVPVCIDPLCVEAHDRELLRVRLARADGALAEVRRVLGL